MSAPAKGTLARAHAALRAAGIDPAAAAGMSDLDLLRLPELGPQALKALREESAPAKRAGRPPKCASGENMRTRQIRMTDAQWADAKTVGMDGVRDLVTHEAARLRAAGK